MASELGKPRRIVTSNLPFPSDIRNLAKAEPAVQVITEDVVQYPELDGNAFRGTVYTHHSLPTSNDGMYGDICTKWCDDMDSTRLIRYLAM